MVNPGLSHSCQQQLHNLGFKENIITATLLNVIYFGTLRINMNNFEDRSFDLSSRTTSRFKCPSNSLADEQMLAKRHSHQPQL